uniref:CSON005908 protein n=1 Tax=Culicoides sonorensis TaxID=179676 RepID=A0A336L6X7_CULSO
MANPHLILESHKINQKCMIFSFRIKEKLGTFNGKEYKTIHYLDIIKWDAVMNLIRTQYLPEKIGILNKLSQDDTYDSDENESKLYLENLLLKLRLKPVTNALLDVMNVKKSESHPCYLIVSIEEINSNNNILCPMTNKTPAKHEETPTKNNERMGTPLPKPRNLRSRNRSVLGSYRHNDTEYQPSNKCNQDAMPEYIPSSTTNTDEPIPGQEYQPAPLNGRTSDNTLSYVPSTVNDGAEKPVEKRRKHTQPSPDRNNSSVKKIKSVVSVSDSDSLAETIDNISISSKPTKTNILFGSDTSDEDQKMDSKDTEQKDSSFDALQKKYESMKLPKLKTPKKLPKLFGGGGIAKPSTSRKTVTKSKASQYGTLQTVLDPYMTKNTNSPENSPENTESNNNNKQKTENRKPKHARKEKEIQKNIAAFKEERAKVEAERDKMRALNQLIVQQVTKPSVNEFPKLVFPIISKDDLQKSFDNYRSHLIKLHKVTMKGNKLQRSSIFQKIFDIVDTEIIDEMTVILHNNLEKSKNYKLCHDDVIADLLIPEWVLKVVMEAYDLEENEARDRIDYQSSNVLQTEEELREKIFES